MNIYFRPISADDWTSIAEIYKQGIETGNATFRQNTSTWSEWDDKHLKQCRIAVLLDNQIAGWAALTSISSSCAYSGVAEISIYIADKYQGQNIGTKLLEAIIKESEKNNLWTLQAEIFPENIASLRIHEKLNFRRIGYREKIGKMGNVWRNTILLERRSKIKGID